MCCFKIAMGGKKGLKLSKIDRRLIQCQKFESVGMVMRKRLWRASDTWEVLTCLRIFSS